MSSTPSCLFSCAKLQAGVKGAVNAAVNAALICFALVCLVVLGTVSGAAQAQTSSAATASPSNASAVSRTAKTVSYKQGGWMVQFRRTELLSRGAAQIKVDNKGNRVEISASFQDMDDASRFGFEYLTYVLWAVSPQGRAVNLGEVQVKDGSAKLKGVTDMQTFALVLTAEPYFAVSQPSDAVAMENAVDGENVGATYQLLAKGAYSSSNTKIDNAIFGVDRTTPVELFQARNAVRIAKNANAEKYAGATLVKADQQLQTAENVYSSKHDNKATILLSRDAVQRAEEARVISVKQQAEDDARAKADAEQRAADERAAQARAEAEEQTHLREQAEQARQQAVAAQAEAERMKAAAEQAAAEAARAQAAADQARQAAIAEQQSALAQKQAAQLEAENARQAAARAEADRLKAEGEKADLRAQLLSQLNSILQTSDSARGLIVNMSDVLFNTGSYVLQSGAREKLAKVSGILLAHPELKLQIEGHTDSVGSDDFNQRLSEQRAEAVRDFLGDQSVSLASITAQGLGKTVPVATNDTPKGRQRNRRVEIVINGDSIGESAEAKQ